MSCVLLVSCEGVILFSNTVSDGNTSVGEKIFLQDAAVYEVRKLRLIHLCEGERFRRTLLFLKYILCDIRRCAETNLLTFPYRCSLFQLKSILLSQMRCLSCWNVCREKVVNLFQCVSVCAVYFYGNLMILGVITSRRFLYKPTQMFAAHMVMHLHYWIIFIYKLHEFLSSINIMDIQ